MKLSDLLALQNLPPQERALKALEVGREMSRRRPQPPPLGRLPVPLRRSDRVGIGEESLAGLHGVVRAEPSRLAGLRDVGTFSVRGRTLPHLVFTPRARKAELRRALKAAPGETLRHLAIRQLALGMMDPRPVPRLCSAYAYWQATGATHAVVPIFRTSVDSADEEEFQVAAHCLDRVRPGLLKGVVGRPDDDRLRDRRPPGLGALGPVRRSMTIVVHGTYARDREWYKPGGSFNEYVRKNVFPDVYRGDDHFFWSGRYSDAARARAAKKLVDWCRRHPAHSLRIIAHSHGANVVNLATGLGLAACSLIHLSPPVHERYLPDMGRVTGGTFFTIRPRIDLVVWLDGGRQNYQGTPVAAHEKQRICARAGHSSSHEPERWRARRIPAFVGGGCAR